MSTVIGVCEVCKRDIWQDVTDDYVYTNCSDFCEEMSDKDKADFAKLQPGEWGYWPCAECGCVMQDEYAPGGHCSRCDPTVNLRKANEKIAALEFQLQKVNEGCNLNLRDFCQANDKLLEANKEIERLRAQINDPQTEDFVQAVMIEAAHQRERWSKTDPEKTDADWYWLIGYLAGKALWTLGGDMSIFVKDIDKKKHRIIAAAAAACNWWRST